ncbi:MAG: TorF family putative porin [Pseudomonadota bacterium]
MKLSKWSQGLAAAALLAGAGGAANAEELSISATWAYESEYIFRGVQFSDSSFQPSLDISYGAFYIGAWAALPVGDNDVAFGDEIDLYAGYGFDISDLVSADVGVTYYTFPDAASGFFDTLDEEDGTGANTVEPYVGFAFAVPLDPSVYFYYDFMFDTFTLQGDAGYSYPLTDEASFDLGAYVGHVFDDDDDADYTYYGVSADVGYAFADNASGSLGVRWGGSSEDTFFDDINDGTVQDNSFWWGLSFGAGF